MYKVGDRVRVITKPNRHEYTFEVGEELIIKKVLTVGAGFYKFEDIQRGAIMARNVELIPNKNLIGGKLL